jgi:hypothetical protein
MRTHHINMLLAFAAVGGATYYFVKKKENKMLFGVLAGCVAAQVASRSRVKIRKIQEK